MTSPYRAHFEVRQQTLLLACLLVINAIGAGGWAILGPGGIGLRILAGGVALGLVVLAVGIHGAREWARIGGIVPGVLYLVFAAFQLPEVQIVPLCGFVGTSVWLALPSTKKLFTTAREMIQRTNLIQREQAAAHELGKRRMAERRKARHSEAGG